MLSVIIWVSILVAVVLCYVVMVGVLFYKKMDLKKLPGHQSMVVVTFKNGLCISMVYFFFVFSPIFFSLLKNYIYAYFGVTDKVSFGDYLAIGELLNSIVSVHSCINPLLYVLPSSRFREALAKYFKKKFFCLHDHNAVAPSSNVQDSTL